MTPVKLDFSKGQFNEFNNGTRRAVACQSYEGNTRIVSVYYYDTEYDKVSCTIGCCCHSVSKCKTNEGAERLINRFLTVKRWSDF